MDKPFFITSRPSDKWGEELVIVTEDSGIPEGGIVEDILPEDFILKMKNLLPSVAVPRIAIFVNRFTSTESGKVIRKIN